MLNIPYTIDLISERCVYTTLHDHLGMGKISGRWIKKSANDGQSVLCVLNCQALPVQCNQDVDNLIERIRFRDETRVHHYNPKMIEQNEQWTS